MNGQFAGKNDYSEEAESVSSARDFLTQRNENAKIPQRKSPRNLFI